MMCRAIAVSVAPVLLVRQFTPEIGEVRAEFGRRSRAIAERHRLGSGTTMRYVLPLVTERQAQALSDIDQSQTGYVVEPGAL